MVETMPYRSKDGKDVWADGPVGLGHLMLHTTPESLHEHLPATNSDGSLVITADARIDNRDELIGLLRLNGRGASATDSDLILLAYEKWGESCVDHFLGDYVFAIWDRRNQKLFCARDHFGVRPFYYYYKPGELFAFGSEIKSLLALDEVPNRLNEVRIADYLAVMHEDKEITELEEILRLPPAHTLSITLGSIRKHQYWELKIGEEIKLSSDEEYAERFRELLTEAVRCRMRSINPVATELSGGLDSSFVTCLARDIAKDRGDGPIRTVSLIFPETPETDEWKYIDEVVVGGGIEPTYVDGSELGPLSHLNEICATLDEGGSLSGGMFLMWHLYKAAAKAGARVLLTGTDGDSTVGHGTEILFELAESGKWYEFTREARLLLENHGGDEPNHDFLSDLGSPFKLVHTYAGPTLRRYASQRRLLVLLNAAKKISAGLPISALSILRMYRRIVLNSLFRREASSAAIESQDSDLRTINPSFIARTGYKRRLEALKKGVGGSVRESQLSLFKSGVFTSTLESVEEFAIPHSLKVAHPYMDKRLIDFALRLPSGQSCKNGWTRAIMRNAMAGIVPDGIRFRKSKASILNHVAKRLLGTESASLKREVSRSGPFCNVVHQEVFRSLYQDRFKLNGKGFWYLPFMASLSYWMDLRYGDHKHDIQLRFSELGKWNSTSKLLCDTTVN